VSRTRTGAALALLALALLAVPGGSSGDSSSPTWAGTWDTDFGDMTLDAGGSGTYKGSSSSSSGTIDGTVDGRVDQGKWDQPGPPHLSGTFKFTMSGNGLFFTGDWEYDQGGCGSACGWNGKCIDGPCLENDDPAPAQPPRCGAASFLANTPRKPCHLGELPIGERVAVDMPEPGKTKNISPREIPPETYDLVLEILAEQEADRLVAALAAKFGGLEKAKDLINGCLIVVQGGFSELDDRGENLVIPDEKRPTVFSACARLLLSGSPPATAGGRVAASGCHVKVVPLFKKGTKVTKRRRARAVAAMKDQVRASCEAKRNGMAISLKARGKRATLNRVTGKNIGAPLARYSNTPANDRRARVRWTARRR
jgi:hypothetical protein